MFSALKKLTKGGDDRCPAPVPMSSSLQKKFSRGVHFNMKILIKGDRNVGKSCLLQRLQGGQFIEEYVPTDQIQAAPIHWTYKNTDHIVKVEVWEVVDKGRAKKKPPLGLKLVNLSAPAAEDGCDTPVLDANFLDVYKNANGVILMFDITKPWTFDYVVKELARAPLDLPAVVLGNHCDMQHHRQVHAHHVDGAMHHARLARTAPVRYAESSMRNGFGLRLLHKFLSVPFLRLQRSSLLEQLQRNQRDVEEAEKELDDFQKSEDAHYTSFVDRLASKRRESAPPAPPAAAGERSPSIVVGGGRPIVPPDVNPLLAQSLNPKVVKAQLSPAEAQPSQQQTQYVSPELLQTKFPGLPAGGAPRSHKEPKTESVEATSGADGALDEFYAGTLDSSFLDDSAPPDPKQDSYAIDSDSDEADQINPMVTIDQDDLDIIFTPTLSTVDPSRRHDANDQFTGLNLLERASQRSTTMDQRPELSLDNEYPLWAGDSSARRSPEGGEDPDPAKETGEKVQKKHKKKKPKEKGDYSDKTEKKEKKKHKKALALASEKRNPQLDLLPSAGTTYDNVEYDDYDSI